MIDVDHFKRFNDDYGHDAGDLVLKSISELVLERVRVYDLACRYGGEELVLLMPGCQIDDAIVKLEAIRIDVAAMQISYQGSMLPPVTISIGVAETHGGSGEALLRQADEALYRAKRQGRNQLVLQDDTMPPAGEMH
jgi:diguanylate cyclase (GGDEF)-like protein